MPEHWKTLAENLPFISLATSSPRIDWNSLVSIGLTGIVSGIVASQVMVVRLEERVANMETRLKVCEISSMDHLETSALLRERISSCEQALRMESTKKGMR